MWVDEVADTKDKRQGVNFKRLVKTYVLLDCGSLREMFAALEDYPTPLGADPPKPLPHKSPPYYKKIRASFPDSSRGWGKQFSRSELSPDFYVACRILGSRLPEQ